MFLAYIGIFQIRFLLQVEQKPYWQFTLENHLWQETPFCCAFAERMLVGIQSPLLT